MRCSVRLEHEPLDPERALRDLLISPAGAGAVVSFVGLVRQNGADGPIEELVLEHHPTLTEGSLKAIAEEALLRFELERVSILHRCGSLRAGEPIVFVAAASQHRRAAFDAVDFMMDRLKTDAVFWKREEGPDGRRWIEPAAGDYEARERWGS